MPRVYVAVHLATGTDLDLMSFAAPSDPEPWRMFQARAHTLLSFFSGNLTLNLNVYFEVSK